MKADPILEELWRVKDELSRQMTADPEGYFARQEQRMKAEEAAGRKFIHSADELRRYTQQHEVATHPLVLREDAPKYGAAKPGARKKP
jgi:hypothetical protein